MLKETRRPRYDAAFQRRAAEQVLVDGLSAFRVARRLHCSPESVKRWCQQHRDSITTPTMESSDSSSAGRFHTTFLPIHVDTPSLPQVEVVTKSGLTLRFAGEMSAAILIDVVRRLESSLC
jgi:transposase-like protein